MNISIGPGDAYTPKSFIAYNWNTTALAELFGFIVVQMDGMGTAWRGKKFEELCYKNLKDAGFPDRELWIKAAAAKYPYMDANNVGIGASAGGQESTTAVLLHGDFYKAAYSSFVDAKTIVWIKSGGTNYGWDILLTRVMKSAAML